MFKTAAGHSAAVSLIIEFLTAAVLGTLTSSYKGYKMSWAVYFKMTLQRLNAAQLQNKLLSFSVWSPMYFFPFKQELTEAGFPRIEAICRLKRGV